MDSNSLGFPFKRSTFGRQTKFTDSKQIFDLANWPIVSWDRDQRFLEENPHERRNPNFIELSNIPEFTEHTVNTDRVNMDTKRMFHYEGGWPEDVDYTEEKNRQTHIRKKLEKTIVGVDIFTDSCRKMCRNVKDIIKMNNQIDMFEEYFDGQVPDHNIEKLSVKTSMLFKDPEKDTRRSINKISWHPDGPNKLAAAYCVMRFQSQPSNMSYKSYVWDINSPNSPNYTIDAPSPIVSLAYNHKNTDEIAFGCYNGRVGFVDVRTPKLEMSNVSEVEHSHHEPVVDLIWLSSKMSNEFVTVSTDGQIFWWDKNNISKPTDKLYISEMDGKKDEAGFPENMIGGTCMEFVPDHGPKYLIGTEKGSIIVSTKKPRKAPELNYTAFYGLNIGRHLGPIYSIKRNPFYPKYFMSVADWSVNIWEEETRTPIMKTRYHPSYLTDGCWAPQRPGVFFVTRKDGWLDIWDFYYRQNEVAFSHKVSNSSLTTIKLNSVTGASQIGVTHTDNGKFAAVGDSNGTITLLELCSSLYETQSYEKETISEIFEREKKREDYLNKKLQADNRRREENRKREQKEKEMAEHAPKVDINKEMKNVEVKFEQDLKAASEDLFKVYLNDEEMTKELQRRLAQGAERKATTDINKADEVIVAKVSIPPEYDANIERLGYGPSNYCRPREGTDVSSFYAISSDTVIAHGHRMGANNKEVGKLIKWRCGATDSLDTEIFVLDSEISWDSNNPGKAPSSVDEFNYVFVDFKGRIVGIDKYGLIILIDVDVSKNTPGTSAKIIAECYAPENCGAAISKDKKSLYYIDKEDGSRIWKHNLATGEKTAYLGAIDDMYNEISNFCLVNEETLFVSFKNSKVGRYDMNKKSFERAVQFESNPNFMVTYLNYVAVVGDLKDQLREAEVTHEIILLDSEMREVGRFDLKDYSEITYMSMRLSCSALPIIFVATAREIFGLKLTKSGKLERVSNLNVDLKNLKGDTGVHSFKIFKNFMFVSDRDGFLYVPIRGTIDDQAKMDDLADHLEEHDDAHREKEDSAVNKKTMEQRMEASKAEEEERKRRIEEEKAQKEKEEQIKKATDFQNQTVGFSESNLMYHMITGPRFDKFCVSGNQVYTICEEGTLFTIRKTTVGDINKPPQTLFQSNVAEVGAITFFSASVSDDSAVFTVGSKFNKLENGKIEIICDAPNGVHVGPEYAIAKDNRTNICHFYNLKERTITSTKMPFDTKSVYKRGNLVYTVDDGHRLHVLEGDKTVKSNPIEIDTFAEIVYVDDQNICVLVGQRGNSGHEEIFLKVYDHSLNLASSLQIYLKQEQHFNMTGFQICHTKEPAATYFIISTSGSKVPIILKKIGENKFFQPKISSMHIPGVSNYSEIYCDDGKFYVGTGRKIFSTTLVENPTAHSTVESKIDSLPETSLILSAMYKDQLQRIKRVETQAKELGKDVSVTKIIPNPDNHDQVFLAKNDKDSTTTILRYNFQTASEMSVVKQVNKLNRTGHFMDIVVNQDAKICGIDNNGFFYQELDNDVMVLTELMTYPENSHHNLTASRDLASNQSRTMGYLVTDDGDGIVEVDLVKANTYRILRGNLHGIQEIKVVGDEIIYGVRELVAKNNKVEYSLFKYDIHTQKVVIEGNINLPTGYHVEAIRLVGSTRVLVAANRRSDKDRNTGMSGEMIFGLFNSDLKKEFMSSDTPVGNKFGVSNVLEVMTTVGEFPIVIVSKGATLYVYAIENENKIKMIDCIIFSEADGPDSRPYLTLGTIDSACFTNGYLYVIRNKNIIHRVKYEGL